jgi:hypothetical protein
LELLNKRGPCKIAWADDANEKASYRPPESRRQKILQRTP